MTSGRLETLKAVEPCEEKALETVWSSPLIIVITAITAVTPTMIPKSVKKVRNLLLRRLIKAKRKDSKKIEIEESRNISSKLYAQFERIV